MTPLLGSSLNHCQMMVVADLQEGLYRIVIAPSPTKPFLQFSRLSLSNASQGSRLRAHRLQK